MGHEFLYLLVAVAVLVGLQLFLKRPAWARPHCSGAKSRAAIVRINVGFVYLFVFGLSIAIVGFGLGLHGAQVSIFPGQVHLIR